MKHIYKCAHCSKYTMKEICECGNAAANPKPLKFTLDDKFTSYRRKAKMDEYIARGFI